MDAKQRSISLIRLEGCEAFTILVQICGRDSASGGRITGI